MSVSSIGPSVHVYWNGVDGGVMLFSPSRENATKPVCDRLEASIRVDFEKVRMMSEYLIG